MVGWGLEVFRRLLMYMICMYYVLLEALQFHGDVYGCKFSVTTISVYLIWIQHVG